MRSFCKQEKFLLCNIMQQKHSFFTHKPEYPVFLQALRFGKETIYFNAQRSLSIKN